MDRVSDADHEHIQGEFGGNDNFSQVEVSLSERALDTAAAEVYGDSGSCECDECDDEWELIEQYNR